MDLHSIPDIINQNLKTAIFRSSKEGLVYVNKGFSELFGYESEEEIKNQSSTLLYQNPDDQKRLFDKVLAEGSYENEKVIFLTKQGKAFTGLINSVLFKDDQGQIFWDGVIRDVTKEQQELLKFQKKERLLHSINKNINEGIYRSIHGEGLIYANDEFARMFRFDNPNELLGLEVSSLYKDPKDRQMVGDEIVNKGSINNRKAEFKRKDGTTFWGNLNSMKVEGSNDQIYFDGAIRDITQQIEVEDSLKRQTAMQNLLIHISSNLINLPLEEVDNAIIEALEQIGEFVEADRVYIFEFNDDKSCCSCTFSWNTIGVEPILADEKEVILSDQLLELLASHDEGQNVVIPDVKEMEAGAQKKIFEKHSIKSLALVPMVAEQDRIGFIGFDWVKRHHETSSRDLLLLKLFSEMVINMIIRSKNERNLRSLLQKTNEQNQRLKDFSYITSHNFRSSVANILGLITVIEDDKANELYFSMMKDTALKLNLAIDSINDLLNLEKDISSLETKDINILQIAENVIVLNRQYIKEKNIEVDLRIAADLTISTLPAYLQSILHNLISNAMKYGVTQDQRKIIIEGQKVENSVVLRVIDKGHGIDMNRFKNKIFQLGSRFHPEKESGHGMGLYMTKQQVEAIGGEITIDSEVNKGTTFTVKFIEH